MSLPLPRQIQQIQTDHSKNYFSNVAKQLNISEKSTLSCVSQNPSPAILSVIVFLAHSTGTADEGHYVTVFMSLPARQTHTILLPLMAPMTGEGRL